MVDQVELKTDKLFDKLLDKKALAAWKTNADLHVLLIMKQHGVSKSVAVTQAYFEGVDGVKKRLGS